MSRLWGADEYNSFALDKYRSTHSVIADPVGTEINQAWLRYAFDEKSSATLGRQRVNHAGQRFLGGVGWRQNEQTFDAASYRYGDAALGIDYSYLWNVNRIFGGSRDSAQQTDFDSDSHAALVSYKHSWGTLIAFVYALAFNNGAGLSSLSYGLAYSGRLKTVSLNASYATQADYGSNPVSYRADFYSLAGSVPAGKINLLVGYEVLGSDSGRAAFSTPLATLHKFQGFADIFLNTPVNGIEDLYLSASTSIDQFNFALTWHDFAAARGDASYGSEWNFVSGYTFSSAVNSEIKYASYRSDGFAVDTDKIWLSMNMAF
jgi:hypothetical protein